MNKIKAISIISLTTLLLMFGCSNDNDTQVDGVIGEWILVSRTISEIQAPLDECEEIIIMTIKENKTLSSQFNTTDIPEKCQIIDFVELIWEKNSENHYRTTLGNVLVSTLELQQNQLIERISDSDWVNFYERMD